MTGLSSINVSLFVNSSIFNLWSYLSNSAWNKG